MKIDSLLTQKLLTKTEPLITQKSSTQFLLLPIQKLAVTIELFLVSLLSFGQA
jgi:hypothetical protein